MIEQRINEAQKLGFKKVILPRVSMKNLEGKFDIELIGVDNIKDAVDTI